MASRLNTLVSFKEYWLLFTHNYLNYHVEVNSHKLYSSHVVDRRFWGVSDDMANKNKSMHRPQGGYSNVFLIRRLGPSIYRSPPKNIRNFKHPKKIFEILATPKISQICTLTLKKDPKMHRNDPQTSPNCDDPKNIHKIFIPKKDIHFSENQKNIEIQNFEPQSVRPDLGPKCLTL